MVMKALRCMRAVIWWSPALLCDFGEKPEASAQVEIMLRRKAHILIKFLPDNPGQIVLGHIA